jgi:hypothetical protein
MFFGAGRCKQIGGAGKLLLLGADPACLVRVSGAAAKILEDRKSACLKDHLAFLIWMIKAKK